MPDRIEVFQEVMGTTPEPSHDAAAHRRVIAALRAAPTPIRGPKASAYERREARNHTSGQRPVLR